MNHLHNIVDAINSREVMTFVECNNFETYASRFCDLSRMAVCFNAGDCDAIHYNISVIDELVRLPFDVCFIEFVAEGNVVGVMCSRSDNDGYIDAIIFCRVGKDWILSGIALFSALGFATIPQQSESVNVITSNSLNVVARFLSALNCSNIKRVEERPPTALNKSRIRKGKTPLFSTWTLSISLPHEQGTRVNRGGHHASPRVHLRRGHARQYKPGLWTWVQPCAVGNPENGMITKDYAARVTDSPKPA